MGGDGGVVATNRKYMRGAGTANHTGDYSRHAASTHNAKEVMTTCALTKAPLKPQENTALVACAYGRLYLKEAAVQALLRRKQQEDHHEDALPHVRKLKHLYEVRCHSENKRITCPISGKVLEGSLPAILLVPGKTDMPNVVSAAAIQQLGREALEAEYGPISQQIRLAPPAEDLEKIQEDWKDYLQKENSSKKKKKDKRSRPKEDQAIASAKKPRKPSASTKQNVANAARTKVQSAIQSSQVLSELFTTKKQMTEKELKDNLFVR